MRTKAQFDRTPRSVFVTVDPPVTHGKKLESAYQDWKPIGSQIISDVLTDTPAPEPVRTLSEHRQNTATAKQSLQSLLSEVNAIMQITPRVNTEKINGYHYTGYTVKRGTNWESPLMVYWDLQRLRKSDARIAYQKNRAVK